MAEPICELLDRVRGRVATPCNRGCNYFRFPQNQKACCLSEVYSVDQGQPCFIFEKKIIKEHKQS